MLCRPCRSRPTAPPACVERSSDPPPLPSPCPLQNDSYAATQLPYFWTALAEIINGRVAMIGLVGLLVTELVRGAPLF